MPADQIHVLVPFKFTLCLMKDGSTVRLVYGTNYYNSTVVGEIYKGRREWMPKGHRYTADRLRAGCRCESFTTLGEARQWLEDGFRAQVLGSLAREDSA